MLLKLYSLHHISVSMGLFSTTWMQLAPKATDLGRITHINGHTPFNSRSFKVTDFGTDGKSICDFLLVINTKLHPISHRF